MLVLDEKQSKKEYTAGKKKEGKKLLLVKDVYDCDCEAFAVVVKERQLQGSNLDRLLIYA